ncbi:class II aldolase/adducin family protein [Bordetella genomosp. 13]|uniref:class II aldolase/adducin family protein n=1 Tax=Bordetella genomosp. 13 TaxID=463040 RepID=UPI0011A513DB|nr:class II aldolase/adducin family protein [Bordetella genomosp. 13]
MLTGTSLAQADVVRASVTPEEWAVRVDLAAAYRLAHEFGWADMIYNHISARVPGADEHFLINPFGLAYDEITASSLIKVDLQGNIVHAPDPQYSINLAGYVVHSAVHEVRHDALCVIHTHTVAGMAVAALKCGLLPLCQTAMRFADIAYHEYEGVSLDNDERLRLQRDLGGSDVMILRNHGLLAVGRSIPEAFNNMYRLERGCQVQAMAMACNTELQMPPEDALRKANAQMKTNKAAAYAGGPAPAFGVMEWPALLRRLDRRNPGYRD